MEFYVTLESANYLRCLDICKPMPPSITQTQIHACVHTDRDTHLRIVGNF